MDRGRQGAGRGASVVARVRDLGSGDVQRGVGLPARGRGHADAPFAVVVDHPVVVIPEHVSGNVGGLFNKGDIFCTCGAAFRVHGV